MLRGVRTAEVRGKKLPSGVDMDSAQDVSGQGQDELAGEVMESVGEPREAAAEVSEGNANQGTQTNDPLYVQKRLKQQQRVHDREMRALQTRIDQMQSSAHQDHESMTNPYDGEQMPSNVDEQIHKAVSYALKHKEMEEAKAKQAEQAAHVNRQYHDLHRHLDTIADKYDDFDDVVRGQESPFTAHMRDASLLLPKTGPGSAGETLYKLGKNKEELLRISKLHPLDQASEIVKLSHALIGGGENKTSQQPRTLGQVKSTPVNNSHATDAASIRARMKAGTWK